MQLNISDNLALILLFFGYFVFVKTGFVCEDNHNIHAKQIDKLKHGEQMPRKAREQGFDDPSERPSILL